MSLYATVTHMTSHVGGVIVIIQSHLAISTDYNSDV